MGYDGTLKFDTSIDSSGFQSGISKISSIASVGIKATAVILAGATTAVVGMGAAAVKVGADFEAGMSKVQAISNASSSDMEKLTDKAKEMGAKTKFSASESAEAFQYMAMAGWKTGDMLDGIEGIMNLAAASGEDLATTSDIVTDALTAFGLTAADSTHFADVLAQASSNANTNVGLMGQTFKYVAPVAGALGFSAEDCAVAIGLMANSGIKSSQAGTALRSTFTRLARPTKEVSIAMKKVGVEITNSDGSMKSLNEVMRDMRKGFADLTQEEKASTAAAIAGQEGMSGLLAIVNASDEDFEKLTTSINNADGAAERMAETMIDNLPGAIQLSKSALETLAISFYEQVQDPLKETVRVCTSMIEEMNSAFSERGFEGLVEAFGSSLAELTQMAINALPELVNMAMSLCESFVQTILDNGDQFASAGALLVTEISNAILSFGGTFWSAAVELFTKFLAGMAENMPQIIETAKDAVVKLTDSLIENAPLIGQSAAEIISALTSAIIENLPQIIDAGKQIVQGLIVGISEEFPGVGAFLEGVFEGLESTLGPIAETVVDALSAIFDAISSTEPSTLEAIGKAVGTIAGAMAGLKVASTVVGGVKGVFTVLGGAKKSIGAVTGVFPKLVEGFKLVSGGAGTFSEVLALELPKISGVVSKIGGLFSGGGLLSTIGGAFSGMASTALSGLASLGSTIASDIGTVVATLGGPLTLAIAGAIAGIIAVICNWDAVKEFFTTTLPNWWSDTVVPFFQGIGESIGDFFSSIPEKLTEIFTAVGDWFSQLPDKIITAISTLGEKFTEWGTSMLETATTVVTSIIDGIVTFFSELPYKIGYAIGFAIGTLAEWATSAREWITTNVPLIIEDIVTFFAELPGKIWDWLTNTFNKLVEWGSQMLQKAGEIASNCIESIVKFFSELPGKVWDWLTNTFNKLADWGSRTLSKAKEIASDTINAIVDFFSELPGKVWDWLTDTIDRVVDWGSDMVEKGRQAASDLVSAVIDGVSGLPSQMMDIGYNIVTGVWDGICNAADWFSNSVASFFSGIVDGVKAGLGINSPSKVFADEVGKWIPPGVGKGMEREMPKLYGQMDDEMASLGKRMQLAVKAETGKIAVDKNVNQTYKIEREKGQSFNVQKAEVSIGGEIHTHVELDKREVGRSVTPIVNEELNKIKKRDEGR